MAAAPSAVVARPRVQRRQVVAKRRRAAPRAKRQPRQLAEAAVDGEVLRKKVYLTVPEAMAYVSGFTSAHAFRMWVSRYRVPKGRVGRQLRFRPRDLDRALNAQPSGDPHGSI